MRIYLAGKIKKRCWRHDVVDGLRDAVYGADFEKHDSARHPDWWPILDNSIFGYHDYVGPFFISCDHGCYHGDNTHGAGKECDYSCCAAGAPHDTAVKLCLKAIDDADMVFCWIDTFDCFGTITEIGYALGMGIPVVIATPPHFNEPDMWFPLRSANHRITADDPKTGLRAACQWQDDRYKASAMALITEPSNRYCVEQDRNFRTAAGIAAHLENYGDNSFWAFRMDVQKVASEAAELAKKGSASWRELIDYAIVRPLNKAVKASVIEENGRITKATDNTKKAGVK